MTVLFEDFQKLDLRIGKIISVEDHPNANKLYVMKVDLGGETRQMVAGLKPYLTPDQLLNKSVAVVANLQPALLRGVESQAMLLAAGDGQQVVLLVPETPLPPGTKIS